jgi:glycosyltransferase involved in cell wall biosynthesis
MSERRKIIFYTHALAGGGAERVWTLLASGFARRGHEVIMAVDYEASDNLDFLDPTVRLVVLGGPHAHNVMRLARLIGREKPDATLSALCVSNIKHVAAAAIAGRRDRAILSYHGFFESEPQAISRASYLLTPVLSRLSARTIAVSDLLADYLKSHFRAHAWRTQRIYNPVMWGETPRDLRKSDIKARAPLVVACGRLVREKKFDSLLRAFARVGRKDAKLVIIGEGPERGALEAEISRLHLRERASLVGYVPEPWKFYQQASCLAVSSQLESFGMVVVEALGHGLPVVATDCKGPREILADGRFGRLVPIGDEAAMGGAISAALDEPGNPAPRIARAHDFSIDRALAAYEQMIGDVCRESATETARTTQLASLQAR